MQDRNIATTLLKGLGVLRAFRAEDTELTQAELARRTGFDRATVRRLCLTLVEAGFVTGVDRGYRLSPRVLTLAGVFLRANAVGLSIQPVLNDCAQRLGAEVTLSVRDGLHAVYVAQSTTASTRISRGFTIGSTLPILSTAVGRMLLAGLPDHARAPLIATAPLERFTPATLTDRAAIGAAISRAAQTGIARVCGEYEAGICGLAVPVLRAGRWQAVLGTSLPQALPGRAARQAAATGALQVTAARLAEIGALTHW